MNSYEIDNLESGRAEVVRVTPQGERFRIATLIPRGARGWWNGDEHLPSKEEAAAAVALDDLRRRTPRMAVSLAVYEDGKRVY